MEIGDRVFFYHSNCKPPGIVGLMEVCELGVIDPTQFDSSSKYHDAASKQDSPRWDCVRLRYLGEFKTMLSLDALKETYSPEELTVVRRGNRLSILPVSSAIATDLLKRLGPLQ
jgi:predicted RNA-binding protein with PUA-like domain